MIKLPDELIYGLIFGVILLVQYLMKRFGPQPPAPQNEPVAEIPEQAAATPEISPLSTGSDIRFGRSGSPSASPALARRRFSRRSLMGTKRDLQSAIVIATILGPCRAFESHDVR